MRNKVDYSTILGLLFGIILIAGAVFLGGGQLRQFIDPAGLLITLGGTVAASMVRHPLNDVVASVKIILKAVMVRQLDAQQIIAQMAEMAAIARRDGILALEKVKIEDEFLKMAVHHCLDGADPEFLEQMMGKELRYMTERHARGIRIVEGWGDSAPAFGLIGSIIGLILMLGQMDDPSHIGPSVAMALVTTLYGALFAYGFAFPMASKLATYSQEEQAVRQMVIDGIIGIQKGITPRLLQESLKSIVPPKLRQSA
ncbi:MAG: motility protein A [Magnetococcales bacterium]|nr:motility protein A [Magnetococcales bacterium]